MSLSENLPLSDPETLKNEPKSYLWVGPLAILFIAGLDQLTKLWAVSEFVLREPRPIIGNFLRFTLVYNEGGAMGTNFGGPTYYLAIGLIVLAVILYYLWNYRYSLRFTLPLGLIAAGAVGNLIDRIRLGKVIDWIDVDFFDISIFGYELQRFWTFNIADSAITLALLYMIWAVFTTPIVTGADRSMTGSGTSSENGVSDELSSPNTLAGESEPTAQKP